MKRYTQKSALKARRSQRRVEFAAANGGYGPREGSTLLIVMVLLGMLSLVGFLFYTFAATENSNARYFADSQKNYEASLDPDTLFDWSLQQLIVGPDDSLTQSALYGKRHSMLPNMFGRDIHPYNSAGIRLMVRNRVPFVDLNYNDVPDDEEGTTLSNDPIEFNDSAPANGGVVPRSLTNWPDPGVDYTYPDINNLFLAYKGFAIDASGNPVQVIIPSFHRPQLLRSTLGPDGAPGLVATDDDGNGTPDDLTERGQGDDGYPSATWYQDAEFAGRMLRPHPEHRNQDGMTRRFVSASYPHATLTQFPFGPDATNPNRGQQGVWTNGYAYPAGGTNPTFELDVDNDGDLIKEGVWLDLNYPVQSDSQGNKFVPLFSFTVYDADGLFNLNAHGNHSQLAHLSPSNVNSVAGLSRFLAGSNQGLTPFEVNPQYALNADPNIGPDFSGTATDLNTALTQHTRQFGVTPSNASQLSNMEWYRLLVGSANFQSATTFNDLYPGRYGEASSVLYSGLQYGITNGGSVSATPLARLPFPGVTGSDDNWNQTEGRYLWEVGSGMPGFSQGVVPYQFMTRYNANNTPRFYPANFTYYSSYPYGQPLDFNGDGTIGGLITRDMTNNMILQTGASGSNNGKRRLLVYNVNGPYKSLPFPAYIRYDNPFATTAYSQAGNSDTTNLNSVGAGWYNGSGTLGGSLMSDPVLNAGIWYAVPQLNSGSPPSTQVDEDLETIVDHAQASQTDAIFGYDEMAALHLGKTDRDNLSLSSRTRNLASFNLNSSTRSDAIAQQFSIASWDRKQFGYAGSGVHRTWELNGGSFPPAFTGAAAYGANDPFRAPVRKMLELTPGYIGTSKPQFRLSLNHLTTTDGDYDFTSTPQPRQLYHLGAAQPFTAANDVTGNLIERPLTPHPAELRRQPIASEINDPVTTIREIARQEWRARLDRQQMARDIYVLLYTLGGGHDGVDYTTTNGYTERQVREMAQFAVNVVDALDPDGVMTRFEYDKNLANGNGWRLDDDALTNDTFTPYATTDAEYNADYPFDSAERGVVFGVEAQQMTLNEVLAFKCPEIENTTTMMPENHSATEHDDSKVRYFTYVELRNVSPKTIDLGGNQWRLRSAPVDKNGLPGKQRFIKFQRGTVVSGGLLTVGNAGETDGGVPASPNHSLFRCDNSQFGNDPFDANDPRAFIAPVFPALDIDLLADRTQLGTYRFQLVDPGTNLLNVTNHQDITNSTSGTADGAGRFFNDDTVVDRTKPNDERPTFILERRQYPDRPAPTFKDQAEENDNPWIVVDRFVLANGLNEFGLQYNDMRPNPITDPWTFDTRLQALKGIERNQPLVRPTAQDQNRGLAYNAGTAGRKNVDCNSLMSENSQAPANFSVFQNLFDRPFASPVELFHIPLYGPQNVTKWTLDATRPSHDQATSMRDDYNSANTEGVPNTAGINNSVPIAVSAGGKILQPEDIQNVEALTSAKQSERDNRWYRLFEFIEIPTRTHRQLGNPLSIFRQPGKLNLNGVRHPAVLAGLLDDPDSMTFGNMSSTRPTLFSNDGDPDSVSGTRDWWVQFLKSRDGRRRFRTNSPVGDMANGTPIDIDASGNPVTRLEPDNVTGLYLPGLADSSPFRSLASAGYGKVSNKWNDPANALDQTIFRRLPVDMDNQPGNTTADPGNEVTDKRHLWEVGTFTEHGNNSVDSVMRHRLLSKIYNNTTTRSHVFIVYVTVQLFQADDTNGAANVRIGGPLLDSNGSPTKYRGFFVIDRSQPEDAYDSASNSFSNFKALIKHRQLLN